MSFFLVGPIAGAVIGVYGYASVFLFALISVLAALGIVVVLRQMERSSAASAAWSGDEWARSMIPTQNGHPGGWPFCSALDRATFTARSCAS